MRHALLAALGVALLAGGEAFTLLGGVDALLFWGEADLLRLGGGVALALSLAVAAWVFRAVLRIERSGPAAP